MWHSISYALQNVQLINCQKQHVNLCENALQVVVSWLTTNHVCLYLFIFVARYCWQSNVGMHSSQLSHWFKITAEDSGIHVQDFFLLRAKHGTPVYIHLYIILTSFSKDRGESTDNFDWALLCTDEWDILERQNGKGRIVFQDVIFKIINGLQLMDLSLFWSLRQAVIAWPWK